MNETTIEIMTRPMADPALHISIKIILFSKAVISSPIIPIIILVPTPKIGQNIMKM